MKDMKSSLKTIKEACFIYGCKREVSKEILGLEKELKEKKLIKIEKLRNPDEIINMPKRKFCEDFNREILDILGT